MSPLFLREVFKFLSAENIAPSHELLHFFDTIFVASSKEAKNITVAEISTSDREIMRTFIDVCEKSSYVQKTPLFPISDILDISSKYFSTLDVKAPSSVGLGYDLCISDSKGKALTSLGFDDKKGLRYGYINETETASTNEYKVKNYLPEGTERLLFSGTDTEFYMLCQTKEFAEATLTNTKVGKKGLLYTLLELCVGMEIDLTKLEGYHTLSDLVSSFQGQRLVAVQKGTDDTLVPIAKEYGISFTRIADSKKIPNAKIITSEGEINIKTGFLHRMFSFEVKPCIKIESEEITPTKYEKLFYSTRNDTEKYELCEATEIKNHLISARCTSNLSFGDGMNTVLDSLFALLSKGADRRNIGITVKVCVRHENLCNGLAALLGAYRTIMELCLPQINSELIFSDEEYILCTAFAKKDEICRGTDMFIEVRRLYLLSFKRFDNSLPRYMPDFDAIRNMCDYLHSAIKDGTVLMAHTVNGALSSVTGAMEIIKEAGSISEDTVAQGFVMEALSFKKIDAPLIGMFRREKSEK